MSAAEYAGDDKVLDAEVERLSLLREYAVLDSGTEDSFERITALGARVFSVPICLVSLVDVGRQWFKSNHGLGETFETPRDQAFCAYTIQTSEDVFVVKDATKDSRFCDNPLVTGPPDIRM